MHLVKQSDACYDAVMRTITLRNLPSELEERLEAKAAELGWSLSRTVTRLLEEQLLPPPRPPGGRRHDDLDHLAGTWSAEEAEEFDRSLREQRRIDPELWD
jgi:hypothetical protein